MKVARTRALMLLQVAALGCVPVANAGCTTSTLKGVYGIVFNGLNGQGQPTTSVVQITSDGAGKLTGSDTQSTDGTISTSNFTGTYSVAKNCTGSLAITFDEPGGYNFVFDNGNKGLYLFNTDDGKTRAGYAAAQGAATCTDAGVKHTYAFEATGLLVGTGDVVYVGQAVLNGTGQLTGTLSTSVDGTITSDESITGTYSISSNCTGTVTLTGSTTGTADFALVVVDGGKQLMFVQSDSGTVVSGLAQE